MQSLVLNNSPEKGEFASILQMSSQPRLYPKKNEVLVKVHYSTITIDDINVAEETELGGISMRKSPSQNRPIVPGIEMSGIVEQVGKNVKQFKAGDSVFGTSGFPFPQYGTWSEYCCVKQDLLLKKPDYLTLQQAAACAGSGMVCASLFQNSVLGRKDIVLIIGASGGVGTLAVQMAKATGAYTIAVCSGKNMELVKLLGADEVIDYQSSSFSNVLRNKSQKSDIVLDCVGGKDVEAQSMKVLKKTGKFKTIVGPVKYIGDQRLGWFGITKMFSYILWHWLLSFIKGPRYEFVAGTKTALPYFKEMLQQQAIVPVIDKVIDFNIDEVGSAISYVRSHRVTGKVVIKIAKD